MDECVVLLAAKSFWLQPSNWWAIFQVLIGLGAVIFVHELGHFLLAKACGVKCDKFYVGFDVPIKLFGQTIILLAGGVALGLKRMVHQVGEFQADAPGVCRRVPLLLGVIRPGRMIWLLRELGHGEKLPKVGRVPDGKKVYEKQINENPEKYFTDSVMEQLEVAVAKEFKYGSAVEDEVEEIIKYLS